MKKFPEIIELVNAIINSDLFVKTPATDKDRLNLVYLALIHDLAHHENGNNHIFDKFGQLKSKDTIKNYEHLCSVGEDPECALCQLFLALNFSRNRVSAEDRLEHISYVNKKHLSNIIIPAIVGEVAEAVV